MVLTLDRAVEDILISGIQYRDDGSSFLQIEPSMAQNILQKIAGSVDKFQDTGTQPILLCGSLVRWELKQLSSRFIPGLVILAFDEIPPDIKTKSVGIVSL